MGRLACTTCVAIMLLALCVAAGAVDTITITVTPQVLVLSALPDSVSIATSAPLSQVKVDTLSLSVGDQLVRLAALGAEDDGLLVLKVRSADLKPALTTPTASLVVRGLSAAGKPFEGSQLVAVKE